MQKFDKFLSFLSNIIAVLGYSMQLFQANLYLAKLEMGICQKKQEPE